MRLNYIHVFKEVEEVDAPTHRPRCVDVIAERARVVLPQTSSSLGYDRRFRLMRSFEQNLYGSELVSQQLAMLAQQRCDFSRVKSAPGLKHRRARLILSRSHGEVEHFRSTAVLL